MASRRRFGIVLLVASIAVMLIVLRISLPGLVRDYLNSRYAPRVTPGQPHQRR